MTRSSQRSQSHVRDLPALPRKGRHSNPSSIAHVPSSKPAQPSLVRVCFDSLVPVQLLLCLIRVADPQPRKDAQMRTAEFEEGQSYCLVDACIDDEMRCATVFQVSPRYRLILGGVYAARNLEAGSGLAYLEFLRDPRQASGSAAAANKMRESDQPPIDSALSLHLLTQGAVLRSAMLKDVTYLTAEQNYVRLHLANSETALVRGPLLKYESVLPDCFMRANRHVIINLQNVQRLRRVSRDRGLVYFAGSDQLVRLGRKATVAVRSALRRRSLSLNGSVESARSANVDDSPDEAPA